VGQWQKRSRSRRNVVHSLSARTHVPPLQITPGKSYGIQATAAAAGPWRLRARESSTVSQRTRLRRSARQRTAKNQNENKSQPISFDLASPSPPTSSPAPRLPSQIPSPSAAVRQILPALRHADPQERLPPPRLDLPPHCGPGPRRGAPVRAPAAADAVHGTPVRGARIPPGEQHLDPYCDCHRGDLRAQPLPVGPHRGAHPLRSPGQHPPFRPFSPRFSPAIPLLFALLKAHDSLARRFRGGLAASSSCSGMSLGFAGSTDGPAASGPGRREPPDRGLLVDSYPSLVVILGRWRGYGWNRRGGGRD
jgi:hypothetical protein